MKWPHSLATALLSALITTSSANSLPAPRDIGDWTLPSLGSTQFLQAGPDTTIYVLIDSTSSGRYLSLRRLTRRNYTQYASQNLALNLTSEQLAAAFPGKPAVVAESILVVPINSTTETSALGEVWICMPDQTIHKRHQFDHPIASVGAIHDRYWVAYHKTTCDTMRVKCFDGKELSCAATPNSSA